MKSIINILSFLAFLFLVRSEAIGQPLFSFEPDHYHISGIPEIFEDEFGEFVAIGSFESTVDDTLYLKWQRIIPPECPNEWEFYIADTQLSWQTSVSTNIDSTTMLNYPMPLVPSSNFNNFELYIWPYGVVGCCTVEIRFSLAEAPDSIIEVATYDLEMFDASCFTATNEDMPDSKVTATPNPANQLLNLSSDKPIIAAYIMDLTGKILAKSLLLDGNSLDVSAMANGLYLLRIELANEKTIWKRVVVQH